MRIREIVSEGFFTSALKGAFTGQGTQQQLTQDIFLRDFYQDALTSLKNGIKGGLVDPSLDTELTLASKPEPIKPEVVQQAEKAKQPEQKGKQLSQTPNAIRKRAARAKQKYDSTPSPQAWEDPVTEAIDPNTGRPDPEEQLSIAEFLFDWFEQYMYGVNWLRGKPIIVQTLNKIQTDYPRNFKANVGKLANLGFALSKAGNQMAAGAFNAAEVTSKPNQQPTQQSSSQPNDVDKHLIDTLKDLKQHNPDAFNKRMNELRKRNRDMYTKLTRALR